MVAKVASSEGARVMLPDAACCSHGGSLWKDAGLHGWVPLAGSSLLCVARLCTAAAARWDGLTACAGAGSSVDGLPWLRNAAPTFTPDGGGVGAGERTVGEGRSLCASETGGVGFCCASLWGSKRSDWLTEPFPLMPFPLVPCNSFEESGGTGNLQHTNSSSALDAQLLFSFETKSLM